MNTSHTSKSAPDKLFTQTYTSKEKLARRLCDPPNPQRKRERERKKLKETDRTEGADLMERTGANNDYRGRYHPQLGQTGPPGRVVGWESGVYQNEGLELQRLADDEITHLPPCGRGPLQEDDD
ncbi:hypothetical protein AOLI_G00259820 [Acnodon oligacanthus]